LTSSRDIVELRALKFHTFAAGLVPAHGNPRILAVNVPVVIDGVPIQPGDLLHGDSNGVTKIPLEIADRVVEASMRVREKEHNQIGFLSDPIFRWKR
jgi:4-hydroxy-4-methyl-2-oxoglutarate aldolase